MNLFKIFRKADHDPSPKSTSGTASGDMEGSKQGKEERKRFAKFKWEFARIPAGEFMMGASPGDGDASSDEKPAHRIRITHAFELVSFLNTKCRAESPAFRRGNLVWSAATGRRSGDRYTGTARQLAAWNSTKRAPARHSRRHEKKWRQAALCGSRSIRESGDQSPHSKRAADFQVSYTTIQLRIGSRMSRRFWNAERGRPARFFEIREALSAK